MREIPSGKGPDYVFLLLAERVIRQSVATRPDDGSAGRKSNGTRMVVHANQGRINIAASRGRCGPYTTPLMGVLDSLMKVSDTRFV